MLEGKLSRNYKLLGLHGFAITVIKLERQKDGLSCSCNSGSLLFCTYYLLAVLPEIMATFQFPHVNRKNVRFSAFSFCSYCKVLELVNAAPTDLACLYFNQLPENI